MTRLNTTFETALVSWVTNNTPGLEAGKAVYGRQKAPRPSLPYARLNIMPAMSEDGINPDAGYTATDTYTYTFRKTFLVSITIVANENYLRMISELENSLHKDGVHSTLKAAGLYFREALDVNDITELVDDRYEFRVNQDFRFGFATQDTETITEIRRVIADIDLGDGIVIEVDETTA